ncbi:hypothetical protein [Streptomyces herbicida]|uniref:hypothetical protein n=1 Tax=Streptomyces herbicida TaxID=3065675 RepID=UPI00293190FB|nr:hypothetical protein [Streptomyces sp. NEAU-HV9]
MTASSPVPTSYEDSSRPSTAIPGARSTTVSYSMRRPATTAATPGARTKGPPTAQETTPRSPAPRATSAAVTSR